MVSSGSCEHDSEISNSSPLPNRFTKSRYIMDSKNGQWPSPKVKWRREVHPKQQQPPQLPQAYNVYLVSSTLDINIYQIGIFQFSEQCALIEYGFSWICQKWNKAKLRLPVTRLSFIFYEVSWWRATVCVCVCLSVCVCVWEAQEETRVHSLSHSV